MNWDGIEYFDPVVQKGVVYLFKPAPSTDQRTIKLKGLDPAHNYRLTFEDGTNKSVVLTGSELMNKGILVTLKGALVSELMFIQKE